MTDKDVAEVSGVIKDEKKSDQHEEKKDNPADKGHFLSEVSLPGSFFSTAVDDGLEEVGAYFRKGALVGFLIWITLLFLVLRYSPVDTFEEPHGIEMNAHFVSFILLLVTNGSRILPLAMRESGMVFIKSGVLLGTLAVQGMAMISNLLMATVPTPVVSDEITGLRVHLVRWVEWIPLTFLMTFLTDNIDVPAHRDGTVRFKTAFIMAISTSAGLIFPFCPNLYCWIAVFCSSCTLFTAIYFVFWKRAKRFFQLKQSRVMKKTTAAEEERYELTRSSYTLCVVCCATWTLLALVFSIICLGPTYAPEGSFFSHPALPTLSQSFFEIASKIWYLSALIDAYDNVFSESTRAVRRLEELRNFMSAVWESSSDVIIFCGRSHHGGSVSVRISPAFLKMVGLTTGKLSILDRGDVSIVLEVFPEEDAYYVFAIDLSKPVTRDDASRYKESLRAIKNCLSGSTGMSSEEKNLSTVAKMAVKACETQRTGAEISMIQDLVARDNDGADAVMTCEAKITRLEGSQSVIVLRDISDRVQLFEAEKRLVKEMTTRKKDAEANRFTRHEVKNGILAAIGLLDHVRETLEGEPLLLSRARDSAEISNHTVPATSSDSIEGTVDTTEKVSTVSPECRHTIDMKGTLNELDSTLRDVLDTILDEAMAREIIYGEYEPRKELVQVAEVLASLRRRSSHRFPLKCKPDPLPLLSLDRQLLRYIYRNAVSNACKYGQVDGVVETFVHYNGSTSNFEMEIVNARGEGHEKLMVLSSEQVASIFAPGTQLSATSTAATARAEMSRKESSGNGAWIMQKCAEALDGRCHIRFERERTVFTFVCPVDKKDAIEKETAAGSVDEEFSLPDTTWGIAIDDSLIQRKLLDRFFKLAGISKSRCRILGENADEVFSFPDVVMDLMENNPDDKFLVIADENLDIIDGGARHLTVSGSKCVETLRQKLDPSTSKRLLALIRSANDSASDLDTYRSRAHGYLLKEPIKKHSVLDVIKPWWRERFSSDSNGQAPDIESSSDEESYGPSSDDLRESLNVIDALCSAEAIEVLNQRWCIIREKLHLLKGDVKTMDLERGPTQDIVESIDRLRSNEKELPQDLLEQWPRLRSKIEDML